jgi:very-short-patch-repair endonuclease
MKKVFTPRAKQLRQQVTPTERKVWSWLRSKQLAGHKFHRQEAIGQYSVDFVCYQKKIIIELDGGDHATRQKYDAKRDAWLKEQGFTVLRFWNNEVEHNPAGVYDAIMRALSPLPLIPSHRGRGKDSMTFNL